MSLKIARSFLLVSVLSVAIVLTDAFFPFIGGKDYFFRISVELALASFVIFWGFEAKQNEIKERFRRISRNPLFLAVSIFVLIFLLASIFAYDPQAAFWSNYERGEGGFQMIHYYIFFVLLLLLFDEEKHWTKIFKFSIAAAILMIFYGIASAFSGQFLGPYFSVPGKTGWSAIFSSVRFQGSLGNPAYVAPYLMFSIFYAFYLWLSKKQKNGLARTIFYLSLITFFFMFFILSQTRGAFLGFGAAIFSGLVYFIFSSIGKAKKMALLIFVALILFGTGLFAAKNFLPLQNLPMSRLLEINLKDRTAQTRLWTWQTAWRGFLERPILGWGPENFSTIFDKHFDTRHFLPEGGSETWFDRAHSIFFDYLAETGILGILSFLAIFAIFYWQFFQKIHPSTLDKAPLSKKITTSHNNPAKPIQSTTLKAVIFALPVGYFVQGLFLFDVLPIYINLFLFLAFIVFKTNPPLNWQEQNLNSTKISK